MEKTKKLVVVIGIKEEKIAHQFDMQFLNFF
jgi:hypothetical protein